VQSVYFCVTVVIRGSRVVVVTNVSFDSRGRACFVLVIFKYLGAHQVPTFDSEGLFDPF